MNTAIERDAQRNDGEADLLRAFERGFHRRSPASIKRTMFSIITIASSTTKPVEIVSAISERLSRLKPASFITPKVPISGAAARRSE